MEWMRIGAVAGHGPNTPTLHHSNREMEHE